MSQELSGWVPLEMKSPQTPFIHSISSLKLCLLHILNVLKDSHTWAIRHENKWAIWIALHLMSYLYFCACFRWKGGGDEGEPEALHHGAGEGVWRAGNSLQLHQDCYCQEWVSTDTWKKQPECCVECPHVHPGDRQCHLFTHMHVHWHTQISSLGKEDWGLSASKLSVPCWRTRIALFHVMMEHYSASVHVLTTLKLSVMQDPRWAECHGLLPRLFHVSSNEGSSGRVGGLWDWQSEYST